MTREIKHEADVLYLSLVCKNLIRDSSQRSGEKRSEEISREISSEKKNIFTSRREDVAESAKRCNIHIVQINFTRSRFFPSISCHGDLEYLYRSRVARDFIQMNDSISALPCSRVQSRRSKKKKKMAARELSRQTRSCGRTFRLAFIFLILNDA